MAVLAAAGGLATGPVWAEPESAAPEEFGDAALGRQYHEQILAAFSTYDEPELAAYVQRIGAELAAQAPGDDYTYRFTVLDLEMVNAFALPGGYIYVTRGLLAHLNSEAQLAAVLGHEIGHVAARHAARQYTAARIVGKVAGSMAAAGNGFNLGALFGAGLVRGYGRDMELEADQTGAGLLAALGYDPHAMLEVLEVLKAREQFDAAGGAAKPESTYHAMLASHPEKDRRTAELIDTALAEHGGVSRDPGAAAYLERIDGLAWAGSKTQGVIRNEQFFHLSLDFAITVPAEWEIRNLPDRLLVQPPARDALMTVLLFDRHEKKRRRFKVERFLQKRLGLRRWQNGRTLQINGLDAFVTLAPGANTPYGERLARLGVIYHGENAYVFTGATENGERPRAYDREFTSIIESFRRLDAAEQALAAPVKIRIEQTTEGTRFADLAATTEHADVQLLRLLNGRYPDGEPTPGTLIKVIR